MSGARLYPYPRCSKSHATLAPLAQRGVEVEVVDYLGDPLPAAAVGPLLGVRGMAPHE